MLIAKGPRSFGLIDCHIFIGGHRNRLHHRSTARMANYVFRSRVSTDFPGVSNGELIVSSFPVNSK